MSADRVIPAHLVDPEQVEAFPYFAAQYETPIGAGGDDPDDDAPLGASLSTPAEDAHRLASVDQVIFEKLQIAEREAQDTARLGYEEGFKSGEAEGRQFGESQYRNHIQRLDGHLGELSASLALNQRATRDEILALALAIGSHLAGRELQAEGASVAPLLEAILEAHPFPTGSGDFEADMAMTIFINPKDLAELPGTAREHPGVTLREDAELSRGGLRIESNVGVMDATIERRMAKLMELIQRFRETEGQ
jgi:flagellar biosynthesis/type III secretory pathway protein FliH